MVQQFLQISSYWYKGDEISVDLLPDLGASDWLLKMQLDRGKAELKTILSKLSLSVWLLAWPIL